MVQDIKALVTSIKATFVGVIKILIHRNAQNKRCQDDKWLISKNHPTLQKHLGEII
jgi:hypothetical protein